jgi:Protein of unknown function (DUF4240)
MTVLKFQLKDVNEQLLEQLKQAYGDVAIELKIMDQTQLEDEIFWNLIDQLDWNNEGDDTAVVAPLINALSALAPDQILAFEETLAHKLWLLDTPAHALASTNNDANAYFSVDGFLYDRCCVVANGQAFYEDVLANPEKFPVGFEFGALLNVASAAYLRRSGELMPRKQGNYETFSNAIAWKR